MLKSSGLYGIKHSNRNTSELDKNHWGKNSFNSSFPTALACYMMDNDIPAIYNTLTVKNGALTVKTSTIDIRELFNCGSLSCNELQFDFEVKYEPYQQYAFDTIDGVDLVVKNLSGEYLRPLEIKLTVLPDNDTFDLPASQWGCEVVARSGTTQYCALGMFDALKDEAVAVRDIFEATCADIQDWGHDYEMARKTPALSEKLDVFQKKYLRRQKPLVMQAIWRTDGKSPELSSHAFDIIVWSDYAFTRLFVDRSLKARKQMTKDMRATARLIRCLYELSASKRTRMYPIYREMTFKPQNDKEFSITGKPWRPYVNTNRLLKPAVHRDALYNIIEPGNIKRLSPERRFDSTLYFTRRNQE